MKNFAVILLFLLCRVVFAQVTIEGNGKKITLPNGKYTIIVGEETDTPPTKIEIPVLENLPDCGCGQADFSASVKKKEGSVYEVSFDACNVNPLRWSVSKVGAIFSLRREFVPQSGTFEIDLSNYEAGEYTLEITSPKCKGRALATFRIGSDPPQTGTTQIPTEYTDPKIVYFNYDDTGEKLDAIKLVATRDSEGQLYISDEGKAHHRAYYSINGSVNRLNASELRNYPIVSNTWIHLVKFVTEVDNVNTDAWRTSTQYNGQRNLKYAASYECTFYVEGLGIPKMPYTQPRWDANPLRNGLNLSTGSAFKLNSKQYGSESIPQESAERLKAISWAQGADKYQLLYANEVQNLTSALGKGVTDLSDSELDRAADMLASMSHSKYFAVDFEPHNPAADEWRWNFNAPNFREVMKKLSQKVYDRSGKYFYSWIGKGNKFQFRGKSFELDGAANDSWGSELDTYIALHEKPSEIGSIDIATPVLTQVGFGYSSTVIGGDASKGSQWVAPQLWYLRALDVLNVQTLITPKDEKLLLFIWPFEDKPSDAKRTPMTRIKLGEGYIKQIDNRVQYPHNLVRDAIVTYLCNPKHQYTQYWIFGESYDPSGLLRWSRINGRNSCLAENAGGFYVSEYSGPDNPACPTTGDYIGKDALSVSAMIQAHEWFAKEGLQDICDGTQVRDFDVSFQSYTRSGQSATPVFRGDTGEFARSYKYNQPWIQVWKNPRTGKRVLLYQDPFADAFETCSFTVTINGQTITRQVVGNNLETVIL